MQTNFGATLLLIVAVIIVVAVLIDFLLQLTPSVDITANTVQLPSNTVILDAPTLVLNCPLPISRISYSVSNTVGFKLYGLGNTSKLYMNFQDDDYLLQPGNGAVVYYKISRPFAQYVIGSGPYTLNVAINNPINISNYPGLYALTPYNGIDTLGTAGINIYVTPVSEVTKPNSTYEVRLNIVAAPNAAKSTYLMQLGATCFSPEFLLTIGNNPYNGTFPKSPLQLG